MPKTNQAVNSIQLRIVQLCLPENATTELSSEFIECMASLEADIDPEFEEDGLFGGLTLTRQAARIYEAPESPLPVTRGWKEEPQSH